MATVAASAAWPTSGAPPSVPLGTCAGLHDHLNRFLRGLLPLAVGRSVMFGSWGYRVATAGRNGPDVRWVRHVCAARPGDGAILVFVAFGVSLCGLWGETCSPDELALTGRLLVGAMAWSSASRADTPSSTW